MMVSGCGIFTFGVQCMSGLRQASFLNGSFDVWILRSEASEGGVKTRWRENCEKASPAFDGSWILLTGHRIKAKTGLVSRCSCRHSQSSYYCLTTLRKKTSTMDAQVEAFYRNIFTDLVVDQEEAQELVEYFSTLNPPPDKLVWLR
jgi:hypothetical protein